ncbi:nucleotidyltransferase family protein [Anaerotignum lactatifermentans]|uniref:Nucleotidyltransferase family protein n=1 Tax=Anaerotignum lactatifermentans TaxID=160404 RepID=A0ABS2GB68_9FIRM|nr:nucleotidyltransferase family protein [Anaerotignum lactatifermentans]MBM6829435.1 nucleotidyltransferase family protein [Anaerotignum lactatifermentans]MBM6877793.1 nucleotidyltransferase family protein [Anaerotignum lactatifermentans]MBM6951012.1 nucleotidyltransferase family protein [Anaerotignum lactatifermentans]
MRIEWILLAAGRSSRFGGNKLLYPLEGKPLCRHVFDRIRKIAAGRKEQVTAVVSREDVAQALSAARVVWNPAPERGLASSIQCALREVGISEETAYVFFVADQPWLPEEEILAFLAGFDQSGKEMGCMEYKGRRGNPGIFRGPSAAALMTLEGDRGGSALWKKEPEKLYTHPCKEEFYLFDIDRKEDLPRKKEDQNDSK